MTQFYVLITALILVVCVAVQTLIHNERRHLAQREIQRAKWRALFDEGVNCNEPRYSRVTFSNSVLARASSIDAPRPAISTSGHSATKPSSSLPIIAVIR